MKTRTRKKPISEINVVPYVDVMLVLLVIFMITAPLLTTGVEVDLPRAEAKTIQAEDNVPIVVSVDVRGQYFLNVAENPASPLSEEALMLRVAAEVHRTPRRPVLVRGDKKVPYGVVVAAMVMLQQSGVSTVGLVTSPSLTQKG